jgi:hypothetical protein
MVANTRLSSHVRRILGGWMDAVTKQRIEVNPSHWWECA